MMKLKFQFQFVVAIMATLAMLANSARHHHTNPSVPSPPPSWSSSSPAPAPSATDCMNLIMDDMLDCLDYLTNDNTTEPPKSCCEGLESIIEINSSCLCEGLNGVAGVGFMLNMTRAVDMPRACQVAVPPPVTNCRVSPAPGASPVGPPDASSPELPPEETPTTTPSKKPPSSAPSTGPSEASSASGQSPGKAGAYAIPISFLSVISLFMVSLS